MSGRVRPTMSAEALALIEAAKAQQQWKPTSWSMLLNVSPTDSLPEPLRSDPAKCPRCTSLRSVKAKVCRSLAISDHDMLIVDPLGCDNLLPNDGNGIDSHRCGSEIAWTRTDLSLLKAGHPRRRVIARVDVMTARRHATGWDEAEADWDEDIDQFTEASDGDAAGEGPYLDSDDEAPQPSMGMTSAAPTRAALYWLPAWMSALERYLQHLASVGFDGVMLCGLDGFEGWGGGARNIQTGLTYREDAVVLLSGAASVASKAGLWVCAQEHSAVTDTRQARQVLQALVRVRRWSSDRNAFESVAGGVAEAPANAASTSAGVAADASVRTVCVSVYSDGASLSACCLHTHARCAEVGVWAEHKHVDPHALARVAAAEAAAEKQKTSNVMAPETFAGAVGVSRGDTIVIAEEHEDGSAKSASAAGKHAKKVKRVVRRRHKAAHGGSATHPAEAEDSDGEGGASDREHAPDDHDEEEEDGLLPVRARGKNTSPAVATVTAAFAATATDTPISSAGRAKSPSQTLRVPSQSASRSTSLSASLSASHEHAGDGADPTAPTTILQLMRSSSSRISIPASTQRLAAEIAGRYLDEDEEEEEEAPVRFHSMADIAESPEVLPVPLGLDTRARNKDGRRPRRASAAEEDVLSAVVLADDVEGEYDVNAMAFGVNDPLSSDSEEEQPSKHDGHSSGLATSARRAGRSTAGDSDPDMDTAMFTPSAQESGYGYANPGAGGGLPNQGHGYGYGRGWGATSGVPVRSSGAAVHGSQYPRAGGAMGMDTGAGDSVWDDSFAETQPAAPATVPSHASNASAQNRDTYVAASAQAPRDTNFSASATGSAAHAVADASGDMSSADASSAAAPAAVQRRRTASRSATRDKAPSRGPSAARGAATPRGRSQGRKHGDSDTPALPNATSENAPEAMSVGSSSKASDKGEPITKVLIDSGVIATPTLCDLYATADPAPAALFNLLYEVIQRKNGEEIENAFRYRSFAHNFLMLSALLQTDPTGNRLLHLACAHASFPALQAILAFLRAHTQPRKRPPKTHAHYPTYMHYASCAAGVLGVVLNGGNGGGLAPLAVACACGSNEMVSLLLATGADIRHSDNAGLSAIHVSARLQRPECTQSLITAGADVNKVARGSLLTPLMCAARAKSLSVVNLLLRHGAQAQLQDVNGHTALAHAVKARNVQIVLALLQADPATRVRNSAYYVFLFGGGVRDSDSDVGVHGWDVCCDVTVDDDEAVIDPYHTYTSLIAAYELAAAQTQASNAANHTSNGAAVTMAELASSLATAMPHVFRRHDQGVLTLEGVLMRAMAVCCFRARDGIYTYTYVQRHITPTNTLTSCALLVRGDAHIKLPKPPKHMREHAGFVPLVDGKVGTSVGAGDAMVGGMFDWCMRAVSKHHQWVWQQHQGLLKAAAAAAEEADGNASIVAVGPNVMGLGGVVSDMFAQDNKRLRCACDFGAILNPTGSMVYDAPTKRPAQTAARSTVEKYDDGDDVSQNWQNARGSKGRHVHMIGNRRIVIPAADEDDLDEDEQESIRAHTSEALGKGASGRTFDRHDELVAGAAAVQVDEEAAASAETEEGSGCVIM